MRVRLLSALVLALLLAVPANVLAQKPTDVVCVTNAVPAPSRESRYFCEPMDSTFFVQFDQFLDGLEALEAAYPDYIAVHTIGHSVEGRPIQFVEVTNEKSPVPRDQKLQLGYSASIHANEAAGREGMTRVIEDLAAGIGPYGADLRPMLDRIIVNVWFPNPDSWASGDYFAGDAQAETTGLLDGQMGVGYARENANGFDLNRQFPNPGWILPSHEPMSQPEARGVVQELRYSGNHTNLVAGSDLHGMLNSPNMMRSIIPNQDYDFRRMVLIIDQMKQIGDRVRANPSFAQWQAVAQAGGTFEDATGISDTLRQNGVNPCLPDIATGAVCVTGPTNVIGDPYLWGSRWDQIGYTDTGFTSDYITLSPRSPTGGMGAVGQIVEFAYSHMVPDNHYVAKLTDMHVAGVREIVRTQMEQAFRLESPQLAGTGAVGYIAPADFVTSGDDPNAYRAKSGKDFDLADPEARFDFNQVPYNVSNINFWRDLGRFSADPFTPIAPGKVTAAALAQVQHLAITDQAIDALSSSELATIKAWVEGGGHLLLTDGALRFFDYTDLAESSRICDYEGYSDLTTRDHPLVAGVDWNARTTGEAAPVGIGATEDGADEYPNWGLVPGSVAKLGGDLLGTSGSQAPGLGGEGRSLHVGLPGDASDAPGVTASAAPSGTERCTPTGTVTQVESLGRVPLGKGHVDFLGAALPRPTQAYDHRYGLADYSVSALTYWIVMNSLGGHVDYKAIDTPFIPTYDYDPLYGAAAQAAKDAGGKGKDTPGLGLLMVLAAVGVALVLVRRRD